METKNLITETNAKFVQIDGVSLEEARLILRSPGGGVGIEDVIKIADCDARRADDILRAMATAGYLRPKTDRNQTFWWNRTLMGNRLALEKKQNRFGREKLETTIAALIHRAEKINSYPDRLQRITLRLFGSALDDRDDYGDVDIAIKYHNRKLSEPLRNHIEKSLKERQSEHERQTVMGQVFGADLQDTREIRAMLKKGMPHISLMSDDPMELGTPFRWLVDYDVKADTPLEVSNSIIRPNTPSVLESEKVVPLPPVTMIKARHREIPASSKLSIEGLHIGLEDVAYLEEAMWAPRMTRDGMLVPNDVRDDRRIQFAGFQHLCTVWKEPISGVAMLKLALDWCEEHRVWVRDLFPLVSISRNYRSNIIRLGRVSELIYFKVGPKISTGSLMPINRTRVSKIDLAGTHAVARALVLMYHEARCAKMSPFSVDLFLPQITLDRLPGFPKLAKTEKLRKGAFAGLLDVRMY